MRKPMVQEYSGTSNSKRIWFIYSILLVSAIYYHWFTAFSLPSQFAPRSESANRTLANSLFLWMQKWMLRYV